MNMNTALHVSAANGHLKIVNLLLSQQGQSGAALINPNIQNESGNTALHYAALNGHKEVVQALMQYVK